MSLQFSENQLNKALVWQTWQRINHARPDQLADILEQAFHPDVDWNASAPLNQIVGRDALLNEFWLPLKASFPDVRHEIDVFLGGVTGDKAWVTAHGHLVGTFEQDWLDIPANGRVTTIRFGLFYVMRDGKVSEAYTIYDIIGVMRQAGFQVMPPSRGAEGGRVPAPATGDGILLTEQDPLRTRQTAQAVRAMINGMMLYQRDRDGSNLASMESRHYWQPDMHWYGPTGIGACLSQAEYEAFHQGPWLEGFGGRGMTGGGGLMLGMDGEDVVAEGDYAALGIWNAPFSHHNGTMFGVPATGKLMTMRDFDWYRISGGKIAQNWVPIDLIDLHLQMGVDLYDRLNKQIELKKRGIDWYDLVLD